MSIKIVRLVLQPVHDFLMRVLGHFAGILTDEQCVKYSGHFDAKWYLERYADIAQSKVDPLEHYLKLGGFEGRFPGPYFDSKWYLSKYPDVKRGINPLVHYMRHGKKKGYKPLPPFHLSSEAKCVTESGLFDAQWYVRKYPDIAKAKIDPLEHYIKLGGFEGRCPSQYFDSKWYLSEYPDIGTGVNPLVHYICFGKKEGRQPLPPLLSSDEQCVMESGLFDTEWYLKQYPDIAKSKINPLVHYLTLGGFEGRSPSPFFDSKWYLSEYPDIGKAINPLVHYIRFGSKEGRQPLPPLISSDAECIKDSGLFDAPWYLKKYPDIAKANVDPLEHYLKLGGFEGRFPGPYFDSQWYLRQYPDIGTEINPLVHFVRYGQKEGRKPLPVVSSDAQCVKSSGLFNAQWYLNKYPDIAKANVDPLEHYIKLGGFEGRFPGPHFDSQWYLSEYPDIGTGVNPLLHYIRFGKKEGRRPLPPLPLSEYVNNHFWFQSLIAPLVFQARKFIWGRIRNNNKVEELWSYNSGLEGPHVSILMPTYGNLNNIERSLQSMLKFPSKRSFEVLIINDNPLKANELKDWIQNQTELLKKTRSRVFTSSMNVGFVSSINILSQKAKGEWLFLLNDDTQICSFLWLDALVGTLLSDKTIGAAGSLLLFPESNLVNHAGLFPVIRGDGNIWNGCFYKYFNKNYHEVGVKREVPMLTGAAFLISRKLFEETGGLDEGYRYAGGFDDADLSNRLTQKGYKLIYVPESVIYHFEGNTNQKMDSNNDRLYQNQQYYSIKWKTFLKKRYKL